MFFITEESLNFHKTFGIPYNAQDCGLNEHLQKNRGRTYIEAHDYCSCFRKTEKRNIQYLFLQKTFGFSITRKIAA